MFNAMPVRIRVNDFLFICICKFIFVSIIDGDMEAWAQEVARGNLRLYGPKKLFSTQIIPATM